MMNRLFSFCVAAMLAMTVPALADLKVGDKAPDFTLQASQGGDAFSFDLADALKKGPVVLYFYPKSFTKGCTMEAHLFSDSIGDYAKLHATVIGVSHDDIATQKQFSSTECRKKFAVAADPEAKVIDAYDVKLSMQGQTFANRTSYVITPDGKIIYTYSDMNPTKHVENTLGALRDWESKQPAKQ